MIRVLCLHLSPHRPSYRYRIEQFLPHWKQYGIHIDSICVSGKDALSNTLSALSVCGNYDYVWIQRKVFPALFIWLLSRRSRLIFDFDDAIYVKQIMLTGKPLPESRMKLNWIASMLKRSALIFAGSDALKSYAKQYNRNVHLIPTAFSTPKHGIDNHRNGKAVTIGWIGIESNLYFLQIIDNALKSVQEKYPDVVFSIMSKTAPKGVKTEWTLSPWSSENEKQWLAEIDIGIMPLTDDEWCRGKCAFKLIQYMAYGKPVVASDVGANKSAIVNRVNGFLVKNDDEWFVALERLILDKELRTNMGEASRNVHVTQYERERVQQKIAGLINEDYQRAAAPAPAAPTK
jgi:glycosyltransferase involved in cell wall biosynthesis